VDQETLQAALEAVIPGDGRVTASDDAAPENPHDSAIAERLRAATALLESIVADRGLLARLTPDERKRLIIAAGHVYRPDNAARRRMIKATSRLRKAARVKPRREDAGRDRHSHAAPPAVFNTPNVFPPAASTQQEVDGDPELRESLEPQHCYICKQPFS